MWLGIETSGMNICPRTSEKDAIDNLQYCTDIDDIWCASEHDRQRARDFCNRAKISFSDELHGESIIQEMRVPDHANDWSNIAWPHFSAANRFYRPPEENFLPARHGGQFEQPAPRLGHS